MFDTGALAGIVAGENEDDSGSLGPHSVMEAHLAGEEGIRPLPHRFAEQFPPRSTGDGHPLHRSIW
jgi:hypothetical protein